MEIEIDLKEVKEFVNGKLPELLNKNCPSFLTSAFILQTLLEKIDELEER
jgi:hypothetical protein